MGISTGLDSSDGGENFIGVFGCCRLLERNALYVSGDLLYHRKDITDQFILS